MAAKKKAETLIEIKTRHIDTYSIKIVGDTPLIVHAWSEKAMRMMEETQMKETKAKAKDARDPFDDFIQSMYWLTEKPVSTEKAFTEALKNGAKFGFPLTAIKQASNSAAYRQKWVTDQMELRGSYFFKSPYGDKAEIISDPPKIRTDMVRIGKGTADLRYRAQFDNWSMEFLMEYNANGNKTLEEILNCIDSGGYVVGIGEWRPEKDGDFGRYHLERGVIAKI